MNPETVPPSFWELIYLQQWNDLFRPALLHSVHSLIEHSERYRLLKYRYPIFLTITSLSHIGSIFTWDSSLIERICGLSRTVPLKNGLKSRLLSILECVMSDLWWIYEKEVEIDAEEREQETRGALLLSKYRSAHIRIVSVVQLVEWVLRFQWLRGKSPYPSVFCWLLRIRCQRLPPFAQLGWFPKTVLYFFYTLQFMEWWLSHADQFASRETPPPPQFKNQGEISSQSTAKKTPNKLVEDGKCPLCKSAFTHPTVVTLTGIVYCYRCIHAFIDRQHKCYVTGVHLENASVLRRIYLQ